MPDSLVAGLAPHQQQYVQTAFTHGLQIGAAATQEHIRQAAESQRQQQHLEAERQQHISDFQNQWALRSLTLAQQAEHLRKMDGRAYFKEKIDLTNNFLKETEAYWDDVSKNPWKYDKATQEGAANNMRFVARKRIELASLNPGNFDPNLGIPALSEQAPYQQTPAFSPEYLAGQNAKAEKEKIDLELAKKRLEEGSKAEQKQKQQFVNQRNNFMGALSGYYNYQKLLSQAGLPNHPKESQLQDLTDENPKLASEITKQRAAVTTSWQKNAIPFLNSIETTAPEHVANLQSSLRTQYGNLESPEDFDQMLQHLSQGDYSGDTGHNMRGAVIDYFKLTTGRADDKQGGDQ